MTSLLRELVARVAERMRAQPETDERDMIPELIESGIEERLASDLVVFIPLAFGRIIMEATGALFPNTYRLHDPKGRSMGSYRLLEHPVYREGYRLAKSWPAQGVSNADFLSVAGRSAEVRCLNQAFQKGSDPKNLVFGEPFIQGVAPPKSRNRWRFWW